VRNRKGFVFAVLLLSGFALGFAASALTAERHPEIHRAQKLLIQAKGALEHAAHDYQGHRVKAMAHIDEAQDELKLALESDHN